jgi:GH25 family lysozyme M1 (1,4-beta-N-acetylmuramidase)
MQGVDVAKWNEITSYQKLKNDGVEFAIVKVINAKNLPDERLYAHITGFRNVGIPCNMGYTYSYANTVLKATKAASAFIEEAKTAQINYMWLDIEDSSMQGLGHTLIEIINIYKTLAYNNGLRFGIYTYISFYEAYIKKYMSELINIPFWFARYPSTKDMTIDDTIPDKKYLPNGVNISGWQYSSKGRLEGAKGYVDLNIFYDTTPITNDVTITADHNPYKEPTSNCYIGTTGNDANWVLWYLWRFGKLTDDNGNPDIAMINGIYSSRTVDMVKEVQDILGLTIDGIVGRQTRSVFKKVA